MTKNRPEPLNLPDYNEDITRIPRSEQEFINSISWMNEEFMLFKLDHILESILEHGYSNAFSFIISSKPRLSYLVLARVIASKNRDGLSMMVRSNFVPGPKLLEAVAEIGSSVETLSLLIRGVFPTPSTIVKMAETNKLSAIYYVFFHGYYKGPQYRTAVHIALTCSEKVESLFSRFAACEDYSNPSEYADAQKIANELCCISTR